MPKACSMPCICKTFTKASSVVIFMAASLLSISGFAGRAYVSSSPENMREVGPSIHGLEYLGEFASGISQHRQMGAAAFDAHAGLRRLDGDAGEQFAVAAQHRHGDADHAIEVFLAIVRHLLLSDLPQLGFEAGQIDNRLLGVAAQIKMLQQPAPARRRREREEQLADGAAMQRDARAAGELQTQRPVLGLDAFTRRCSTMCGSELPNEAASAPNARLVSRDPTSSRLRLGSRAR
jgi:hypothetical protein